MKIIHVVPIQSHDARFWVKYSVMEANNRVEARAVSFRDKSEAEHYHKNIKDKIHA